MPVWIGPALKMGLWVAGLLIVVGIGWWLYRRGQDRAALRQAEEDLKRIEETRSREREIREAVDKVRRDPGPAVPDLGVPDPPQKPPSP